MPHWSFLQKVERIGEIEYLGIDLDPVSIKITRETWKNTPNARFEVGEIKN